MGRVSGRSDKAIGCAGCCCERCNLVRDEARSSSILADPASGHYGKCADVREVFAGGLLSGCGAGLLWLRLEISLLAVQGGEEGRSRQPWLPGSNAVAGGVKSQSGTNLQISTDSVAASAPKGTGGDLEPSKGREVPRIPEESRRRPFDSLFTLRLCRGAALFVWACAVARCMSAGREA